MEGLDAAIECLSKDYLLNVSMIEPLKTGSARLLYFDGECVFAEDLSRNVLMMQTENLPLARDLLSRYPQAFLFVAHNRRLSDLAREEFGFSEPQPCYQAAYRKGKFEISAGDFRIRPMREDEAPIASRMYGFSEEDALEHIRKGLVLCGCEGETVAVMIGMHTQGSMGLLFVEKEFRRKGYAELLEKTLINRLLEKGLVPYAQIVEGNEASLSLQRKLSLELSDSMIYWHHRKPKEI